MNVNKNEMSRLVSVGLEENDDEKNYQLQHQKQLTRWKATSIFLLIVLIGTLVTKLFSEENDEGLLRLRREDIGKCMFCDQQSKPTLYEELSYKILTENNENATVIPMTITYNYELYDGQLLFTDEEIELIPNLEFDYAILAMRGLRNINRETNEPVSLDEVYFHHFTFYPLNMVGAEVLTRNETNPYMKFPSGYGLHILYDENPNMNINAHLLSNKNLQPIDGSIALAHKQCNECYYSEGKGTDCTPDVSGTFKCCGDSQSCTAGGEFCGCATKDGAKLGKPTKYQVQVDVLISPDLNKFKRVDQWSFAAPACHVNLKGGSVFKEYLPDNYCYNNTGAGTRGSLFHQIEVQDDDHPYVETKINTIAPTSGTIVWAQSHLHTGGINATLRLNGEKICSTGTTYGTESDENKNARNEQNHLIQIDSCYDTAIFQDGGIHFNEGDVLTTESIYDGSINDDRFVGYGAAGEHKNVMSMFFLGVVFEGDTTYLTEKHTSFNHFGDFVYTMKHQFTI